MLAQFDPEDTLSQQVHDALKMSDRSAKGFGRVSLSRARGSRSFNRAS